MAPTAASQRITRLRSNQGSTSASRRITCLRSSQTSTAPSKRIAHSRSSQTSTTPSKHIASSKSNQISTAPSKHIASSKSNQISTAPSKRIAPSRSNQTSTAPSKHIASSKSNQISTAPSKRIAPSKSNQISTAPSKCIAPRSNETSIAPSKHIVRSRSSRTSTAPSKHIVRSRSSQASTVTSKHITRPRNSQASPIHLRPRRSKKNYCEDSKLLQQYISSKQQDSIVIVEKLKLKGNKKVPVYKAIKSSPQKSMEDRNDVYDFKFDINDVKEKAVKKKQVKRNVDKGKGKTAKKTTRKKITAQSKTIGSKVTKSKPDADLSMEIAQSNPLEFVVAAEITKENNMEKIELEINTDIQTQEESINKDIEEEIEPPRIDADIQMVEKSIEDTVENMEISKADTNIHEETTLPGTFVKQTKKENANKPTIVSVENANNIIVVKSPSNDTRGSWPFRPKNISDNKTSFTEHNSTLKCSLLTKTYSPILKMTNTLDIGSPWRSSALMFSQTKHFTQSTPFKNFETNREKIIHKKSMETNKDNVEMNKENVKMDKENMDVNKENKGRKERKKKIVGLRKEHLIQKKLPVSEYQVAGKVQTAVASKSIVQPAPARVSLGEIKNLLLNVDGDNKQTMDQAYTEVDKPLVEQKNKQLVDYLSFSDTFDVLPENERLSNIGNDAPLFMDLEPSHFSKPPQHSYRRKRAVRFEFSEGNGEEEEEPVKLQPKKKKLTKSEKEQEKRINEWVQTINTTFQEIEEHDLIIE